MQRLLTEPRIIFFYISQLFFPHPSRLSLEHDVVLSTSIFTPFTTILSISGIILCLLLAYYFRKKEPIVSFSIFWFFGNHLIESTFIPLELIFEHRNYLPSMLVPLIFVVPAVQSTKFTYLKTCLLIAVIVFSCFWTFERNKVWQYRLAMEADNVQKAPLSARAHTNYAKTLFTINEKSKAMRHLTEALRLKPGYEDAEALTWIIKFGAIEPTQTGGHYFLDAKATFKNGIANLNNGNYKEAIIDFTETLKISPKYKDARSNIGVAYWKMGNFTQAKRYFQEELNINPNHLEANLNLGMLYEKQKKYEMAAQQYKKILKIYPKHPYTIKRLAGIKSRITH
jgi:tetratricopeptide (TPR) repeat protein